MAKLLTDDEFLGGALAQSAKLVSDDEFLGPSRSEIDQQLDQPYFPRSATKAGLQSAKERPIEAPEPAPAPVRAPVKPYATARNKEELFGLLQDAIVDGATDADVNAILNKNGVKPAEFRTWYDKISGTTSAPQTYPEPTAVREAAAPRATGEIKPITQPEVGVGSVLAGVGKATLGQLQDAQSAVRMAGADLAGNPDTTAREVRAVQQRQLENEMATPDITSTTGKALYSGAVSIGQNAASLAAGVATGSPFVALASMVGPMSLAKYAEYRAANVEPLKAAAAAFGQGAVEWATEKLPMGALLKDLSAKAGFGKILLHNLKLELPGEQAATVLQDAIDQATLHPEKTWSQYLAERPAAAYQTLVATALQSGVMTGAAHAASKVGDALTPEAAPPQARSLFSPDAVVTDLVRGFDKPQPPAPNPQVFQSPAAEAAGLPPLVVPPKSPAVAAAEAAAQAEKAPEGEKAPPADETAPASPAPIAVAPTLQPAASAVPGAVAGFEDYTSPAAQAEILGAPANTLENADAATPVAAAAVSAQPAGAAASAQPAPAGQAVATDASPGAGSAAVPAGRPAPNAGAPAVAAVQVPDAAPADGRATAPPVAATYGTSTPLPLKGIDARASKAEPPAPAPVDLPDSFPTKSEANLFAVRNKLADVRAVQSGVGWTLQPVVQPETAEEAAQNERHVQVLNDALARSGDALRVHAVRNDGAEKSVAAQVIRQVLGIPQVLVRGLGDNGLYFKGVSYVSDALSTTARVVHAALHEAFHWAAQAHPDVAQKYLDAIGPSLTTGVLAARQQFENANLRPGEKPFPLTAGRGANFSKVNSAEEEVAGDIWGDLGVDPQLWVEMRQKDPGLFQAVRYRFMEGLARTINALSKRGVNTRSLVAEYDRVRDATSTAMAEVAKRNRAPTAEPAATAAAPRAEAPAEADVRSSRNPEWKEFRGKPTKSSAHPGLNIEVAPNPENRKIARRWSALSTPQRDRISRLIADKYLRKALDRMGVRYTIEHTQGGFLGETNPSIIIRFTDKSLSFDEINEIGRNVGKMLDQQAVITYDENLTKGEGLTTFVKLVPDRELTQAEIAGVFLKVHESFPDAAGFTFRDGGLVFGNFSEKSAQEFHDGIDAAVADHEIHFESFRRAFRSDYLETANDSDTQRAEAGREDLWRGERGLGALQAALRRDLNTEIKRAREPGTRSTVGLRDGTEDLSRFGVTPGAELKVRELAEALDKRAAALGRISEYDTSDRARDEIAATFADEIEHQLTQSHNEATGSGEGWYSVNWPAARAKLAQLFPEIGYNRDAQAFFTMLLAFTSNGERVPINLRNAIMLYDAFVHDGARLTEVGLKTKQQAALEANLAATQRIVDDMGVRAATELLLQEMTVSEMNAGLPTKERSGDYPADAMLPRAAVIFGPKLGAFFANLMGSHGYLTMDLWWTRSFNRVRGNLVPTVTDTSLDRLKALLGDPTMSDDEAIMRAQPYQEEYEAQNYKVKKKDLRTAAQRKNLDIARIANTIVKAAMLEINQAPLRAEERAFMIATAVRTQEMLAERGHHLTIADVQAALWYYEKRLYRDLNTKERNDIGYEEAIDEVLADPDRPQRPAASADRFAPARRAAEDDRGADVRRSRADTAAGPAEPAVRSGGSGLAGAQRGAEDARGWSKRSPQPRSVSVDAWHYGLEKTGVLSGLYYGRGIKGEERERVFADPDWRVKRRVYFYIPKDDGSLPSKEEGLGPHRYEAKLGNLYDGAIGDPRVPHSSAENFESALLDAGYDGYISRKFGMAVVLNADVPATYTGIDQHGPARAEPAAQARLKRALLRGEIGAVDAALPALKAADPTLRARNGSVEYDPAARDALNAVKGEGLPRFSKAFKEWFGDSKAVVAVNADTGEPLTSSKEPKRLIPQVMYHATRHDVGVFEVGRKTVNSGTFGDWETERQAIFVTPDLAASQEYAKEGGRFAAGANVMPVYVKAENPLDLTSGVGEGVAEALAATGHVSERFVYNNMPHWDMFDGETGKSVAAAIKAAGYDSVVFNDENPATGAAFEAWALFRPEQIKSAIGNNGNFDPKDPDIRRAKSDALGFYSQLERVVENAPIKVAPAEQWKAWLNGNAAKLGVKADEIAWSGITDWLDMQKGKVTREAVSEYLAANGVRVEETVLGGKLSRGRAQQLRPDVMAALRKNDNLGFDTPGEALSTLITDFRKDKDTLSAWDFDSGETRNLVADYLEAYTEAAAAPPKYDSYVLPGGADYRELLLTLPVSDTGGWVLTIGGKKMKKVYASEGEADAEALRISQMTDGGADVEVVRENRAARFQSNHWNQPNVLAHIRFNERADTDGKRVMFVEEIQSDWGQRGKKKGFTEPALLAPLKDELARARAAHAGAVAEVLRSDDAPDNTVAAEARVRAAALALDAENSRQQARVPAAPFVTKTEAWVALALKRAISYAVQNGFDKVAFTNGAQNADRYDLSKQVEMVTAYKETGGSYRISATDNNGNTLPAQRAKDEAELEGLVGKDLATKIVAQKSVVEQYSGLDLKVGGEGMVAFYDKIVPQVARDVLKKIGGGQMTTVDIEDRRKEFPLKTNVRTMKDTWPVLAQPGFDITPAMRAKVAEGLPRFSKSQESTPEFKRWFGDSKVVDENGAPKVMYHGTSASDNGDAFSMFDTYGSNYGLMGAGSYFTDNPEVAAGYTKKGRGPTPTIYPVYLAIKDPIDMDAPADVEAWTNGFPDVDFADVPSNPTNEAVLRAVEEYYQAEQYPKAEAIEAITEGMRSMGFDGVTHTGGGRVRDGSVKHRVFIAFDPEQIKSATGNNGEFSPGTPDIRRSIAAGTSDWDAPKKSLLDTFLYGAQDKQIDLKRVTELIKAAGNALTIRTDAYLREELYQGRVADRTERFLETELKPLLKEMRDAGITIAALDEYLHARHAEERNLAMQRINQARPNNDALSGMSTADANKILAAATPAMKALGPRIDLMIAGTRDLMEISGIESAADVDALRLSYADYVPLHRDEDHPDSRTAIGLGYSVKGTSVKRALGSEKRATNILAHIVEAREATITRAEKNVVALAIYAMARQNPNPDFWTTETPPKVQWLDSRANIFNPGTGQMEPNPNFGQVVMRADPNWAGKKNVVAAKMGGVDVGVVFNERDERAMRMATALKNLDALQLGWTRRSIGSATRWLAAVNTQYNPVFSIVNFTRDIQGAVVNLSNTPISGKQLAVLAQVAPALRAIYRAERGKAPTNPQWAALYDEFKRRGSKTGFRKSFVDIEDRAHSLQKEIDALGRSAPGRVTHAILDFLGDANDTIENGVRLAAYKTAIDNGIVPDRAASIAKNLTVNFNRKGAGTQELGLFYAFFNAAVQGNARVLDTLVDRKPNGRYTLTKRGARIIAGGLALGVMQALLLASADDDDEKAIPEYIKRTSYVIPLKGSYIAIPMPLGLHVIPNIGRTLTDIVIAAASGEQGDIPGKVAQMLATVVDTVNPMGGTDNIVQMMLPTVADPIAQLSTNKGFSGTPIYRERSHDDPARPGFEMGRDSTNPAYKGAAYIIHMLGSGFNKYARNTDLPEFLSPQPEALRLIPETVFGGVWREGEKLVDTALAVITGAPVEQSRIPLVSRFSGDLTSHQAVASVFYKNVTKVQEIERTAVRMAKDDVTPPERPETYLVEAAKDARRQVAEATKRKHEASIEGKPDAEIDEIENEIAEIMREFNAQVREARKK